MGEEADGIIYSFGLSDDKIEVQHNIKQLRGSLCLREETPI